ncbi:hypothetical protein M3Y95_00632300 [Aphelenchoides besseyi]|nr:hypothetical protein M3Y95_00632300 [Aphelenchoides besseyi]
MWSFISGFVCGQYIQPKAKARALLPPENPQEEKMTEDRQTLSPTMKLQEHFEDEQEIGNETEAERVKSEFLHNFRSQNAAPMFNEDIQEEYKILQLKHQFLQIRPDFRFAETHSLVHNSCI